MLLVVILYAVLASTFILAKKALLYANPCFLIGFRMILAGVLLVGYHCLARGKKCHVDKKDYQLFFKTALFHIYFAFVLEFWALQYITALKTTLIYSSTPFIAALLAYLLLKEKLSAQKCLGILVGLGGLVPVLMVASTQAEATMEFAKISLPELVLLTAVASSAYAWFLVKQLMNKGYSLIFINGITMFFGGVASMLTAVVFEGVHHPVNNWYWFLVWTLALIIVANIVVYNLYGWLLKHYSITFITFSGFLCPGFGALYEWLFMSGQITWHYLASLALVALGLYIFHRNELKKQHNIF